MRRLRIALFACLAVVLLAACDTGWIQPGGGPDNTSYNAGENVLTLANVTTLQQAFHATGAIGGAPLVKDGVLVVGSGSTVTGFDATTGAQKWQVTLPSAITGGPFIDSSTPTVRVSYAGTGSSFEQTIDLADGSETWPSGNPIPTTGPMVARRGDNSVRVNSASYNPLEGPTEFAQISGKALDGGLAGVQVGTSFTLGQKYLYVESTFATGVKEIFAYDPNQACGVYDVCGAVWASSDNINQYALPPAIGPDGTLYVGSGGIGRGLRAVDGNTGSTKWASSLPLYGTPAVANGVVYSNNDPSNPSAAGLVALSAADGHTLWTGTTPAYGAVVAGGVVYGTNGSEVVAYNANGCGQATCAPVWTASLGTDTPEDGIAVTGGMLYVSTNTGVTAFKPTS